MLAFPAIQPTSLHALSNPECPLCHRSRSMPWSRIGNAISRFACKSSAMSRCRPSNSTSCASILITHYRWAAQLCARAHSLERAPPKKPPSTDINAPGCIWHGSQATSAEMRWKNCEAEAAIQIATCFASSPCPCADGVIPSKMRRS
jgi:hypothetical protein